MSHIIGVAEVFRESEREEFKGAGITVILRLVNSRSYAGVREW
jgi:hypothetical protein